MNEVTFGHVIKTVRVSVVAEVRPFTNGLSVVLCRVPSLQEKPSTRTRSPKHQAASIQQHRFAVSVSSN